MELDTSPFAYRRDRDRDRRLKKAAVLREAARQFCAHGYAATQMSEVARQLGVTKPVIYYYFKSKEDVLLACFETGHELMQEALAAQDPAGSTARTRLETVLRRYGELICTDFGRCTVRIHAADLSPAGRQQVAASRRRFDTQLRQLFVDAVADGSIPDCDVKLAAFSVLGSLHWLGHWFRDDGPWSREEAARLVVKQAMAGVGPARQHDAPGSGRYN